MLLPLVCCLRFFVAAKLSIRETPMRGCEIQLSARILCAFRFLSALAGKTIFVSRKGAKKE